MPRYPEEDELFDVIGQLPDGQLNALIDNCQCQYGESQTDWGRSVCMLQIEAARFHLGRRSGVKDDRQRCIPKTKRRVKPRDRKQMVELHLKGWKNVEIAGETLFHRNTVGDVIKEDCNCEKCQKKRTKKK